MIVMERVHGSLMRRIQVASAKASREKEWLKRTFEGTGVDISDALGDILPDPPKQVPAPKKKGKGRQAADQAFQAGVQPAGTVERIKQ